VKRVVESPIPVRLLSAGLWVVVAVAALASVVEETRGRCVPGQTRDELIAPAALSAGVATCLTLWRRGRSARAAGLGVAVGLGVAALLFALGLLSWVHDCAN
jgi:hypothetical protein